MSDMANKPKPSLAPVYASIYPELATIARRHGYALAIHGSLVRDFDLIAVPWAETVSPHDVVIAAICNEFSLENIKGSNVKPHGRVCYTLVPVHGHSWFLDFSFTPSGDDAATRPPVHTHQPRSLKRERLAASAGLNRINSGRWVFTARVVEDPPVPCTRVEDWEYAAGHAPMEQRIRSVDWWLIERLTDDGQSWELTLWRVEGNVRAAKRLLPLWTIEVAREEVLEPEREAMKALAIELTNEEKETEPCPKDRRRES